MTSRGGRLLATVLALPLAAAVQPSPLAGQVLDSLRAHALVLQMADDIRRLDGPADLVMVGPGLREIEAYFGITFELPEVRADDPGMVRRNLDEVYRTRGADALLDEAARIEEDEGGRWLQRGMALETIARAEGPRIALEAARERDLLESGIVRILSGAGLRRIDEVLAWVEEAGLDPDLALRLRAQAFGFGSLYEPYRYWQRADALPEPHRTDVRVRALASSAGADTVPDRVLAAELPGMLDRATALEPGLAAAVSRAVAATCERRRIEGCADFDLPTPPMAGAAGSDVVNLTANRAFGQATNRLDELRRTEPPLVVARIMARGLESLGRTCLMAHCDLVGVDSLAAAWTREILAVEDDALAGRIERTATWNGQDDLVELQRALAVFLVPRDLTAARAILLRMEDEAATNHVLQGLVAAAHPVDLIGAVELFLEFAPDGDEAAYGFVPYTDLLRAGRPDLAEAMLERAGPHAAMQGLLQWTGQAIRAGRTEEAREALRTFLELNDFASPPGTNLLGYLERVRMLETYLDHVQTLPTPRQRVHGLHPLVWTWVQTAARRRD